MIPSPMAVRIGSVAPLRPDLGSVNVRVHAQGQPVEQASNGDPEVPPC